MNIPEEFGKYLLLKKLTEDPLGETFRAGKSGKAGIEQVVLLRVFNGKGLDGESLWQKISGRGAVQEALRSPNIGTGVELGKVRSFPYAAYDYISGKSLAVLLAQSAKLLSPIPTDHALLIAERLSLALAAAYETKVQDERVQHGFVVPHLVMVSNEGETRLLGFEVAPGLRALAAGGWDAPELRPYLSPEALSGSPLAKSDDVWSLGAILFELLTGSSLPALPADGYPTLIDSAALPGEGTPLPPAIVALLKKSLVPRDQRLPDVATWHKTLSKLMIDGQYSPTTFNLAFFMHNLFREEIERESQEMQAEKKLDLPMRPAAPVPVSAPPVAPERLEASGIREGTLSGTRAGAAAVAPSKAPLFIGIAAAVLILAGAGGWYFLMGPGSAKAPVAPPVPVATPVPQPPPQPAAPAGPTQEELKAQIQQMLDARSQEMEAKLKAQYDDRIKQLQQQLETKKKEVVQPPPEVKAEKPAPTPVDQTPPVETRTAQKPAEQTPAPVATPPPAPVPTPTPAEQIAATPPPAPTPTPRPTPPPRQVQYGDLIQPGTPGVQMPHMVSRLDPRYPAGAQRLNRSAQVDIKVLVDEKGHVLDAQRAGPQAGFGFDEAAIDAARRATFQPATTKDGIRVKMWVTIRVSFKPHG
jgi:TonB family protein